VFKIGKQMSAYLTKAQKKYRRLRALAALLVVVFSVILGSIIGSFIPLNSAVVSQAAQALVGVDGFLAAASGVIAFFYYGKLLEFASPTSPFMLALRPIVKAESEVAMQEMGKNILALGQKFNFSKELNPQEIAEGQKAVFETLGASIHRLFEGTGKLVGDLTMPARRMAYYASFVLLVLVVSAFFSILGILSGSAPYLGLCFGLTVLGSGADAHVNLIRYIIQVQAHEGIKSVSVPQGTG
jgi:hypothetical protein